MASTKFRRGGSGCIDFQTIPHENVRSISASRSSNRFERAFSNDLKGERYSSDPSFLIFDYSEVGAPWNPSAFYRTIVPFPASWNNENRAVNGAINITPDTRISILSIF